MARRDSLTVEGAWPGAGPHRWVPVVRRRQHHSIGPGNLAVLKLVVSGFEVPFPEGILFSQVCARCGSTRPTVVADTVYGNVVDHSGVVDVANTDYVHVGNG